MNYDRLIFDPRSVNVSRVVFEGLGVCGCGGKLDLYKCQDKEYMDTFYVECENKRCGFSVGRRYDPINNVRRGEVTDAQSAVEASNLATGHKDTRTQLDRSFEWINVEDRLPDPNEWVLASMKFVEKGEYGTPIVARLRDGKWYSSERGYIPSELFIALKITHWSPLPANPEVKK